MSKIKLFTCVLVSVFLFSFSIKNGNTSIAKKGFIYKLKLNIDENLMERALVKNANNTTHLFPIMKRKVVIGYKSLFIDETDEKFLEKQKLDTPNNEPVYEMLDSKETDVFMTNLCEVFVTDTAAEDVQFLKKSTSGKALSMLGNVASNAMGKNKLSFSFPNKKLKRVKYKADEYYEIKMDFIYGGATDFYIVMNKQKGQPSIKFKIKTIVIATDKKGNTLWEKEQEIKDFSDAFAKEDILEDKKGKFFNIKRAPRLFNSWNKEPIGDYISLSKKELKDCIKIALSKTIKE
tara:strand:+ start:40234 stop:41106 length:873 start_codon:yes stop_codon:yes gene_type:complete